MELSIQIEKNRETRPRIMSGGLVSLVAQEVSLEEVAFTTT